MDTLATLPAGALPDTDVPEWSLDTLTGLRTDGLYDDGGFFVVEPKALEYGMRFILRGLLTLPTDGATAWALSFATIDILLVATTLRTCPKTPF